MAVFDTFGIVTEITEGHVPTAYLLALIGMLFTAMSYGHLVRKFPSAGSATPMPRRCSTPMWASWWAGSPCSTTCSCP